MAEAELPNPEELRHHGADSFARGIALVTAIFAVLLALAALGGNHAMKEMLLAQQQSSDQWAFYQAKSIREHQYRGQKLRLEADLADRGPGLKPEVREKQEALLKRFGDEEQRYNADKKEIEKEARKLEHERDVHRNRDPYFDYAEVFLQIAIVMASVSILSKSRSMFLFSFALALVGAALTVNGFTLWFALPFMHAAAH